LSEKELAEPKICFYVRAKEVGNSLFADDQSTSNVVCQEGPFTYYVPNTIVSDGINNRFIVKGVNIDTTLSNYTIFNRWGEILHKSESIFEPWYPVYQGVDLMPGMYFYILELFSNKGERKTVKGEIRIIK
jgi:gliding motility-associated-like protein